VVDDDSQEIGDDTREGHLGVWGVGHTSTTATSVNDFEASTRTEQSSESFPIPASKTLEICDLLHKQLKQVTCLASCLASAPAWAIL
jgi:hypothetical protein